MTQPVGRAPVQSVTLSALTASVTQMTSVSLLARTWQGKELQVLHRMQPPGSPGDDHAERQVRRVQAVVAHPVDHLGDRAARAARAGTGKGRGAGRCGSPTSPCTW